MTHKNILQLCPKGNEKICLRTYHRHSKSRNGMQTSWRLFRTTPPGRHRNVWNIHVFMSGNGIQNVRQTSTVFSGIKIQKHKMLLSTNISIQKDNALLGRDTENGRVGGFKSRINTVYFCKGESVQRVKRSVKVSKIYKIINTIFLLYKTFKWK